MLIFLDIETTGLDSIDRICSIGIIGVDSTDVISMYELINEDKKISSKASSVNYITNEMIKNKPKFKDTKVYNFLKAHNNEKSTIITHNMKLNLKMLLASKFQWCGKIIDTKRVTKHLISECDEFSLQFLKYELKLYMDEKQEVLIYLKNKILIQNALGDALIIKLLYSYLLDIKSYEELIELSFKDVLMEKFKFGKYSDRYIEEIAIYDRNYLEWMLSVNNLDDDLKYTLKYHLS
ncbi:MAG: 3'-5' exonuclease [Sulfurimonas sp.]|nr:3'-5' exonuclease [Sulfurimonas sp.]